MKEIDISFPSGDVMLRGTFATPEHTGSFPCVLLVPGSGQVDRNESHRKLPLNTLREIAERLSTVGFASLRFDKRGVGESDGDYWTTGLYDNAQDVFAALSYLASRKDVVHQQVFLLGHSEGAILATHLAAQQVGVAGVILLSGSARSGEETLAWQTQQVARTLKGFAGWLIRLLHIDIAKAQKKNVEMLKASTADVVRVRLIAKVNARWMREFLAYDPSHDFGRIRVPILAITGSDDIQTDPSDLARMRSFSRAPFESHYITGLSHILRDTHGEKGTSGYRDQVKEPVDSRVLDAIAVWLHRQVAALGVRTA